MLVINDNTQILPEDEALVEKAFSSLQTFTKNRRTVIRIMHAPKMREAKGVKIYDIPERETVNSRPNDSMMAVLDNLQSNEWKAVTGRPLLVYPEIKNNRITGDWKNNLTANEIELLHTRYGLPMYYANPFYDDSKNIDVQITSFMIPDGKVYNLANLEDAAEVAVLRNCGHVFADENDVPQNISPAFVWYNEEANISKEAELQQKIADISTKLFAATNRVKLDVLEFAILKYPQVKADIELAALPSEEAAAAAVMYCSRLLGIKGSKSQKPGYEIVQEAAKLREQKIMVDTLIMHRLIERSIWRQYVEADKIFLQTTGLNGFREGVVLGDWNDVLNKMQTPEFQQYRLYGERAAKAMVVTQTEVEKSTTDHAFFTQLQSDTKNASVDFSLEETEETDTFHTADVESTTFENTDEMAFQEARETLLNICRNVGWTKMHFIGIKNSQVADIKEHLKQYPNVPTLQKLLNLSYAEFQTQAAKIIN